MGLAACMLWILSAWVQIKVLLVIAVGRLVCDLWASKGRKEENEK